MAAPPALAAVAPAALAAEPASSAAGALACAGGTRLADPLDAPFPPHTASNARVATSGPDRSTAASTMMSTMDPAAYDELSLFQENASEFGLPWPGPPSVRREDVALTGGGTLSALVWGPDVGPRSSSSSTARR